MSDDNWYYFPRASTPRASTPNPSELTAEEPGGDSRLLVGQASADSTGFIVSAPPERPRLIIRHEDEVVFELDFRTGFGRLSEGVNMNEVALEFFSALSTIATHFDLVGRRLCIVGTVVTMTLIDGPEDSKIDIRHTGENE